MKSNGKMKNEIFEARLKKNSSLGKNALDSPQPKCKGAGLGWAGKENLMA
jgi:hypothetical protein